MAIVGIRKFGFLIPSDSVSTGSSIMPQKKTPDPIELVRGKSARVIGDLVSFVVLCKGLPHAYNQDLQEDKEPVFDSVKTIVGMLEVSTKFAQNITFNQQKIQKALPTGHLDATTAADYLVKKVYPAQLSNSFCTLREESFFYDMSSITIYQKRWESGEMSDMISCIQFSPKLARGRSVLLKFVALSEKIFNSLAS